MFGRGDKVAKYGYFFDKRKKIIKKLGLPSDLIDTLSIFSGCVDEEEYEESDDVQYEYIDLVFPPDSTPPTRNSNKKINFADFNQIHKMIC
jgi:hypothetical protein